MPARGLIRRAAGTVLVSSIAAAGLVALAPPAAAESFSTIARSSWAYTDVREPRKAFTEGDAPVGAWRDDRGRYHASKSYFTFDLSELRGTRVLGAQAFVAETAANDCGKPRATEMWATDTVDRPTWIHQPRERTKLPGPGAPAICVWNRVEWDATAAVQDAFAAGRSRVTLALRMPQDKQFDVAYGRHYSNNVQITVRYNRPPSTPTDLLIESTPCIERLFIGSQFPQLSAVFDDPDGPGSRLTATFAVWPVDEPTRRTELSTNTSVQARAAVTVPGGVLVDAGTYEWAVRASDDFDTSAWSAPCRFTVDITPPPAEPGVSSQDYPEDCPFPWCGGVGVPGRFTFTAGGVADVVGYKYGDFEPVAFVAAEELGGSATVTLTPQRDFLNRLAVRSVDRAGNVSPTRIYTFFVRDIAPVVVCTPEHGGLGEPRECTLSPGMPEMVAYKYVFDGGPEITLPARGDGTATVTIRPVRPFFPRLVVRSIAADGFESVRDYSVFVAPSSPGVVSDVYPVFGYGGGVDVPGEFSFSPHMPNVAEYVYQFDNDPEIVVPADAEGGATITYTPTTPERHDLAVRSRTADGVVSVEEFYPFFVQP